MEKIKEELNNLIDLYNERKNIEKLTKNIEEKKKELEKLDNKVKLEIPETTKNIAQKEFENAKKDFDKMQQDKKNRQDELNKKFENHKKNLLLMIDEEIYKELNNLQSSKNAYEKIASNAENTVNRLIKDFNEGKNIDQSMLISARKEIEFNRKKVEQIGKKIEEYVVGATNPEQYSDLTYLKMRVNGLYLENLNKNTEKDFYEKYFKEKEIIKPTDAEQIEQKNDKQTELDNDSIVDEYLKEKEKLGDFYKKLLTIMRKIIELDKSENYNELDEKLQKANAYTEVIRKLLNKIEEIEKSGIIEKLEGKNIIRYAAIDQTEKGYIDTIMKMSNVIEKIEERATKSKDDQTVDPQSNQSEQQEPTKPEDNKPTEPELTEQEKRKMVEKFLILADNKTKEFKELINSKKEYLRLIGDKERFSLYSKKNANKMITICLSDIDVNKENISTYKKQLNEMEEKVKPYLEQKDMERINEYEKQENEYLKQLVEIDSKIQEAENSINLNEIIEKNDEDKINANNIKVIPNKEQYKEQDKEQENNSPIIMKYTTDDKKEHTREARYDLEKDDEKAMIKSALKTVYPEIDFESEDGKQELKKYENADPNIVMLYRNNKDRLEEYAGLLNGEIKRNKKDENSLKITYDISNLSKIDMSDKEKKAFEDYAFKHRHIAEVKKTLLQSVKFTFRGFKEKIFNSNKTKLLNSGIVTGPVKEEFSKETGKTISKMIEDKHKKEENINDMDKYVLSDEEKQKLQEENARIAKENIQKQKEETIKWQIKKAKEKIATTSGEEKAEYEKILKEKLNEQAELTETAIDNEKDNSEKPVEELEDEIESDK